MSRTLAKQLFGWGALLWLIGYVLGIVLVAVVAPHLVGWIILPIGVALTWWVLVHQIHGDRVSYYVMIGIVWTIMAIVLDYLFIVKAFHPADGYYKLDVYLYYALTLALPLLVGWQTVKLQRARPAIPGGNGI